MTTIKSGLSVSVREMAVCVVLVCVFGLSALTGCDSAPPPPPAPARPTVAPPPRVAPVSEDTKKPAPSTAPSPEPLVAKPPPDPLLPSNDGRASRDRLLAHYGTLRCLIARGAQSEEIAAAFASSGLDPGAWEQALGGVLGAMAEDPHGEVAQAVQAANARPCGQGAAP